MEEREAYEVKGKTTKISATSRVALKVRDNFYTVEFTEEREIPDVEGVNLQEERNALFDAVNIIVDGQCDDILRTFQGKK